MSWRDEFAGRGVDFDVPEPIIRIEGLADTSWHNNVCPSFGLRFDDCLELTIWCDAPNREDRENGSEWRFIVAAQTWDDRGLAILHDAGLGDLHEENAGLIDGYGTNDPYEAVAIFLRVLSRLQAAYRAARKVDSLRSGDKS